MNTHIRQAFDEAQRCLDQFMHDDAMFGRIDRFAGLLVETFEHGGRVYSCGNGGSMCDAMHFAEEFTGRYRRDRRPLPALAFSDPAHMSCVGNDHGFDEVFARQVQAHGRTGDMLLVISTSGNSPNLLRAAVEARSAGVTVVGLLGKGGGPLLALCDHAIIVPGSTSDRIQELHIKIIHTVIEMVERHLFPENYAD